MPHLDQAAARLAASQHGLIVRHQALELGFGAGTIQHRRSCGRWLTVTPGVYLIHGSPFTWHARVLAECLSTGGIASHRTAAVLHEVAGFRPGIPEITVRRGRFRRRPDLRQHESVDLDLDRPVTMLGIPTSSPARLAVDLGGVVSFPRYEAALDDLIGRGLLSWDDALDSLLRHAKRGRNGVGALRALLAERYGSDVAESALERAFARRLRETQLPEPVPQYEIGDDEGFVARVDYAYPDCFLAIELDSRAHHLTVAAFEDDRRKRNRLRLAGWLVLDYTWRMVIEQSDVVFGQIARAHRERSRRPTSVRDQHDIRP